MNGSGRILRYARALYEAADETASLDSVRKDLTALETIVGKVDGVRSFCLERRGDPFRAAEFVKAAFLPYVGPLTANLLTLLAGNNALGVIPFLPTAFGRIESDRKGILEVEAEFGREPGAETVAMIALAMGRRTGKTVRLTTRIVPELLGGFRIIYNNRILDQSAVGRLARLRKLIKDSSQDRN